MLRTFFLIATLLFLIFTGTTFSAEKSLSPSDIPRMTIDQLKAKLGNSDLAIIDVRSAHDWEESNIKIKGAVREDPAQPGSWIEKYPLNKTIVLYCKWINEATSASVALQMMSKGYKMVYALKGGWADWEKAGYQVEPKNQKQ